MELYRARSARRAKRAFHVRGRVHPDKSCKKEVEINWQGAKKSMENGIRASPGLESCSCVRAFVRSFAPVLGPLPGNMLDFGGLRSFALSELDF